MLQVDFGATNCMQIAAYSLFLKKKESNSFYEKMSKFTLWVPVKISHKDW